MSRFKWLVVLNILLVCLLGQSSGYASDSQIELWDYTTSNDNERDLDTTSLHILRQISATDHRTLYRGITITRPRGDIFWDDETHNSSAVGAGPVYLLRYEQPQSGKLSAALDVSGGILLYNKKFPYGGQYYNFMWRIGPQLIYRMNEHSYINIGYTLMHVSNGLRTHNPGYDSHGISWGFVAKF
ncbi:acyloxyacyl hydrolase [Acetonema longum]|uniref:Lipid A 3-O-deacylase-related protein n=1 Tax=Acetonema longum DSM 6540 TaxID=1009370 RepID=F7NFR3_9FIRM|nr:acyloxyacyl hydrolase [Acetonema longum]EGO65126.1 hypothetical protein ALO_04473 [Acetonema longum DSM 6540]